MFVMEYKSLQNEAPGYLQELCRPVNTNTRRSTLRSASDGQLTVYRTKTKAGERAFSVAGPRVWNGLPVYVRQLPSIPSFKRHSKHIYSMRLFQHDAVNTKVLLNNPFTADSVLIYRISMRLTDV